MADKNPTQQPQKPQPNDQSGQEQPPKPAKRKMVILVADAYEKFRIGGQPNSAVFVSEELAAKMVAAGVAKYQ